MLLSLFTPTNRPDWLTDVYRSLRWQSYENWEWVIIPNGPNASVPDSIRADPRVRVIPGGEKLTNIGALKRFACDNCCGQVFVEMDHDDMLVPGDTLRIIADKIKGGAGFVFSDVGVFHQEDLASHRFGAAFGWEAYNFHCYGRRMQASRCFEIGPRTLSEIYFCPDHVRSWSRAAYYKAEGHDRSLSVCDDHDLMCKTYLAGYEFAHTGGCHYLYRMHASNTVTLRNTQIHEQNIKNKQLYVAKLVREWCRRKSHPILDMSIALKDGWKWERDLYNGLAGPYGLIIVDDVLQLCPKHMVAEFMNMCHRALLPGGFVEIRVPSTDGRAAYMDPRYQSQFNSATFLNYTRKNFADKNPDIDCRFQLVHVYDTHPDDFHKEHDLLYTVAHLAALKGQRWPGLKHIRRSQDELRSDYSGGSLPG